MMGRYVIALSVVVVLVISGSAFSAIIETEPNDTMATADVISSPTSYPWSDVGICSLDSSGSDIDYFKIWLNDADTVMTVVTTPLTVPFTSPDTLLGLFDSSGTLLVSNDDSGGTNGSTVMYDITTSDWYYIAVTGSGDTNFAGIDHGETGNYMLTVSVVPEPATLAMITLGGLLVLVRRRRH